MGSVASIGVSLTDIWHAWNAFYRGKKRTIELDTFAYSLEKNLNDLHEDVVSDSYIHGPYRTFSLTDTKKRKISVASIRDRVVHRLLYDYLISIVDKTFLYDAWSCRKNKGLLGAIKRTQSLLYKYRSAYVWRGDITKFFDSVDQDTLKTIVRRRIFDRRALRLIDEVIDSYSSYQSGKGMPIGNLTSQVFTNMYLHEFDWCVTQTIRPLGYVRYGDDFILIAQDSDYLKQSREYLTGFIDNILSLTINAKNDIIVPVKRGVHFLGCDIYPTGRRLRKKTFRRIENRLNLANSPSYRALVLTHSKKNIVKWIDWHILEMLSDYL